MIELRERDRRALMGLGLAVAVYVVLSFVVFPAYDVLANGAAEAAQKEEDLRKYRRAVIRKGHYAQLLAQARTNMAAGEERLIRGDNPSLASVEFQTIVEQAAVSTGVPLGQRSMSAAKKKDDFFNEITMTLSFECTPNQLAMFLAEIRKAPKFITVRNAQVSPTKLLHDRPANEDFQKTVRANLTLGALLASPPKAGA